ncbi:mechanosensitive ion channel [Candidatus Woesearchaeota archaeon]|nr:mechanosensitive ion channel [Candidatus Woesearchaeota archaeon]
MAWDAALSVQEFIYRIITSIIILLTGFGIGIFINKALRRLFEELKLNQLVSRIYINFNLELWISRLASYFIYLGTFIFFLNYLNIELAALYLFLGAVILLLVIFFIAWLKDVLPNYSGWLLLKEKGPIAMGSYLQIGETDVSGISGIIEKSGWLETRIKTKKGDILHIPNSLFLNSKFTISKD